MVIAIKQLYSNLILDEKLSGESGKKNLVQEESWRGTRLKKEPVTVPL